LTLGTAARSQDSARVNQAIGLILDRGDVLGADVAGRIDPDSGDAGSKVVFREEFVARWFAHAHGDAIFVATPSRDCPWRRAGYA
jgi:hypothetical protein